MPERPSVETSQPEHKEHEPKINYHFLYSAHRTAEDFKNLEEAFKKADIYVPEMAEWTNDGLEKYRAVSEGLLYPKGLTDFGSSNEKELEVLYKSRKPIIFVDTFVARDKELIDEENQTMRLLGPISNDFKNGDFGRSLIMIRSLLKDLATTIVRREAIIKENLRIKIDEFVKNNPEYNMRPKVEVLVSLGAAHTSVFMKMRRAGEQVERKFSKPLLIYGSFNEALRRNIFGKEVSDELLAKAEVESFLLFPVLKELTQDTLRLNSILKKITNKLTFEDIRDISEKAGKNGGEIDIVQELEARGIKVPKTEEEMDKMLGLDKNKK